MVTLAQRLEELRTERGLSRPALSAELGFPKNAVEKFETGRATPTRDQMEKMAAYFEVSASYLRGESRDRLQPDGWMDAGYEEEPVEPVSRPERAPKSASREQGTGFHSFLNSKGVQDMLRSAVLDVLRSPEGQEILRRVIQKELDQRK